MKYVPCEEDDEPVILDQYGRWVVKEREVMGYDTRRDTGKGRKLPKE